MKNIFIFFLPLLIIDFVFSSKCSNFIFLMLFQVILKFWSSQNQNPTVWKVSVVVLLLARIFPHLYFVSLRIQYECRENADQNSYEYGDILRSVYLYAVPILAYYSVIRNPALIHATSINTLFRTSECHGTNTPTEHFANLCKILFII